MAAVLRLLTLEIGATDRCVAQVIVETDLDATPIGMAFDTAHEAAMATLGGSAPDGGDEPEAIVLHGAGLADRRPTSRLVGALRERWPAVPVVVVHDDTSLASAGQLLEDGVADIVPAEASHLRAALLMRSREALEGVLRRRAESATRRGEERFRRILNELDEGIVLLDGKGRLLFSNLAARELLSLNDAAADVLALAFTDDVGVYIPLVHSPIGQVLARGGTEERTMALRAAGGDDRWLHVRARALPPAQGGGSVLVSLLDLTTTRRASARTVELEAQLQHTQRLNTLGEMAGGIAHDFNNILAPISGYADLASRRLDVDSPIRHDIEQIRVGAKRAQDLTRQIAMFGGHGELRRDRVDVAAVAAEALGLLRASLPSTIELRQRSSRRPAFVLADETQMHQIVVNLCTNAGRAMDNGGMLSLNVANVEVGDTVSGHGDKIQPGPYVRLRVVDSGCGMDMSTLERIFEPFFTLRRGGEGSGLGLSVVHGIVQQHSGAIRVRSVVGKGTCFDVYLPEHTGPARNALLPDVHDFRGSERLLIVDDEPAIVEMLARSLELYGYFCQTAFSSPQALSRVRAQPDSFDVLLTDYTMPRMTGLVLSSEARLLQPDLRVIMMTGYRGQLDQDVLVEAGVCKLMLKPVDVQDLAREIRIAMASDMQGGVGA